MTDAGVAALAALIPYAQHLKTCGLKRPRSYRIGLEGYVDANDEFQTRRTETPISGPTEECTCGLAAVLRGIPPP